MDERREELAALQALRLLEGEELRAYEEEAAQDPELRALTAELENTAAALAAAVPLVSVPTHLKARIMDRVQISVESRKPAPRASSRWSGYAGWGIAACLAVAAVWLANDRAHLATQVVTLAQVEANARQQLAAAEAQRTVLEAQSSANLRRVADLQTQIEAFKKGGQQTQAQLAQLTKEIDTLRSRDAWAQMQIATLQTSVDAYKQGVAVVVWDSEKHQGVLKLEKMPPVEAGKDYQLWVVDPKKPAPVDAGVVRVDAQGFAKVDFKPVDIISEATKFALSVEKEGGVPKGQGPIILIGP